MDNKQPGRVAVLMGSDSDLPVMAAAVRVLRDLEIGHKVHVTSAHRSPARTVKIVDEAAKHLFGNVKSGGFTDPDSQDSDGQ